MKKESRIGILVSNNRLHGICVFRGRFLEHLFLGYSKEDVFMKLKASKVAEEIRYSNFNIGMELSREDERILVCRRIIDTIDKKLNI